MVTLGSHNSCTAHIFVPYIEYSIVVLFVFVVLNRPHIGSGVMRCLCCMLLHRPFGYRDRAHNYIDQRTFEAPLTKRVARERIYDFCRARVSDACAHLNVVYRVY